MSERVSRTDEIVILSVTCADISVLMLTQTGKPDVAPDVEYAKETWCLNGHSLDSETGSAELLVALQAIVTKLNLAGRETRVLLSSDYCATRVLRGENEEIDRELLETKDRSAHYIALGNGLKTTAESRIAIDAKTTQAWLTVTEKETIETVVEAVESAGLIVLDVQHSLFADALAVRDLATDSNAPALVMEVSEQSVEIGIVHEGQLLLSYRPGGHDAKDNIIEIINRHQERLNRYCRGIAGYATEELESVVIYGPPSEIEAIRQQFADQERLHLVDPDYGKLGWNWKEEPTAQDGDLLPLVGAAQAMLAESQTTPNLLAELRAGVRGPLVPILLRTAWPIAAALLLTLGFYIYTQYEAGKNDLLQGQRDQLESSRIEVVALQRRAAASVAELGHLKRIESQVKLPDFAQLVRTVGGCMPNGVWLQNISVLENEIRIGGPSHTEDGVFEFARYLEDVPYIRDVNIEAMEPISYQGHRAFKFDVKCRFADRKRGNDKND